MLDTLQQKCLVVSTDVYNNIVQANLDEIVANLLGDAPALAEAADLRGRFVGKLVYDRRVWRIEVLQLMLLDAGLECLLVASDLSWSGLGRGSSAVASLLRWRGAILLLPLWWISLLSLGRQHKSA